MKLLSAFRSLDPSSLDGSFIPKSSSIFWLAIHSLCCIISLILGFRFSHLVLFFLLSTPLTNPYTNHLLQVNPNVTSSRVVVGRHGIRIRPWPHPNPIEVVRAHQILKRVQNEQKSLYGVTSLHKRVIAVTPTYVRTFQALHLTGVMHSLMLVPHDVIWIVVEAGGKTNETATFIGKSKLKTVHVGFDQKMPNTWEDRRRLEAKMRIRGMRIVREEKLDGVVVFVDDSNMHSMELFDEVQNVRWFGALSVGILMSNLKKPLSMTMPIQGPSCDDDSSGRIVGWHVFDTQPYATKSDVFVDDKVDVMMEWSGFVFNSRLLWKGGVDDRPSWVEDVDKLLDGDEEIDGPLSLVKDPSMVEPLGSCGRNVLIWWLRVEARADSKFPPGWIINSPLDITVPSKRTPWTDSSSKRSGKPRGTESKNSREKQEPKGFDGIKVSAKYIKRIG